MSNDTDCARISVKTLQGLKEDIEDLRSLVFSLIAAHEAELYYDVSEEKETIKGTDLIRLDEKSLMRIFARTLHEQFYIIDNSIEKMECHGPD